MTSGKTRVSKIADTSVAPIASIVRFLLIRHTIQVLPAQEQAPFTDPA
jgi:hypothetical protein